MMKAMKMNPVSLALALALSASAVTAQASCPFCISETQQLNAADATSSIDTSNRKPVPEYYNIAVGGVHEAGIVDENHEVIYAGKVHPDYVSTHEIEQEDGTFETVEVNGRHLFFTTTTQPHAVWATNATFSTEDLHTAIQRELVDLMSKPGAEIETGARSMRFNAANERMDDLTSNVREVFTRGSVDQGAVTLPRQSYFYGESDAEIDPIFTNTLQAVSDSGEENTDQILQGGATLSVADACRELGDDWFLPSLYELSYLSNALKGASNPIPLIDQLKPKTRYWGEQLEALWSSNEQANEVAYVALTSGSSAMSIGFSRKDGNRSMGSASEHSSQAAGDFTAGTHTFICARH